MRKSDEPRRQHPISILFFIVKFGRETILPLIPLLLSTALNEDIAPWVIPAILVIYVAAFIAMGILSWYRFVYRIEDRTIRVEQGVFIRKRLSIPRDRVHSVDMSAGVVQRLFGVRKLVIETAGSRRPEVVLSAVTEAESERIRAALVKDAADADAAESDLAAGGPAPPASGPDEAPESAEPADAMPPGAVYRVPAGRILLYSATTGRVFLSLAIIGALYSQVEDLLGLFGGFDPEAAGALLPDTAAGWIAATAAALLIVWLLGTAIIAAKEYGFTVERRGGKLLIRSGLFEKKQFSVSLERIQAVHVHRNPLRRLFGCASVSLVTFASVREDFQINSMLCPLVPVRELPELLATLVPEYEWPEGFERPGREAVSGYIAVPLAVASVAAVPGLIWLPGGWRWIAPALPLAALLFGLLRYRQAGWHHREEQIAVRFGAFGVQLVLIPRRRIQWLRMKSTPLQERRNLATLQVITASSGFAAKWQIRHIPRRTAEEMMLKLRRPRQPAHGPAGAAAAEASFPG
jgi:putative membrane protein